MRNLHIYIIQHLHGGSGIRTAICLWIPNHQTMFDGHTFTRRAEPTVKSSMKSWLAFIVRRTKKTGTHTCHSQQTASQQYAVIERE